MAIGDRHLRVIEAGSSYTPAAGIKELITNINLHNLSDFEIKYAGQIDYINLIDLVAQSPYTIQNPGFILTDNITIRQKVSVLIMGMGTNLLRWSEDQPNIFYDLGNIDNHCENAEYERIDGIHNYNNGDLLVKTQESNIIVGETRNLNLYRINPNNVADESGSYGPLVGSDTFILPSGSSQPGSVTFGPNEDIYVMTAGNMYKLNPNNIADQTGTYRDEIDLSNNASRALIYDGTKFIAHRTSNQIISFLPANPLAVTLLDNIPNRPAYNPIVNSLAIDSSSNNFYMMWDTNNVNRQGQIRLLNKDDITDMTGIFGIKSEFASEDFPASITQRETVGNSALRILNGMTLIQSSSGFPIRISTIEVP